MKTDQIFIGDIRKCTKYNYSNVITNNIYYGEQCIGCDYIGDIDKEDELYKENAILIKIKNKGYIDLERLNSILDYIKINKGKLNDIIMLTFANSKDDLFVDEDSLRPYYKENKNITLHKLKKTLKNKKN